MLECLAACILAVIACIAFLGIAVFGAIVYPIFWLIEFGLRDALHGTTVVGVLVLAGVFLLIKK